ncbi:HpcH/HpaI aldolase/citrate lyase family protein [Roseomonas sp. 18066]|uniref:HpcH/HpaI aldolase family protein n=1 Tax=Roseomonas sp. 18066 TaxID=2681412 RepID=UPI001357F0A1|nr:aldolase/citrate lyase family protein [Roseomonas sp. 18066]
MTQDFKRRLRAAERLLGFFIGTPSAATVEIAGFCGYDFAIIDTEHGPAGLETVENMLRAAAMHGMAGLVRVPDSSVASIQRVLDAGADGILVPHVASAAIARDVVDRALFTPQGRRGVALARSSAYGVGDAKAYYATRNQHTVVIVMIEDAEALPVLDEILAVPGIDAVFIGPGDLSASLGHPGAPEHPSVQAAVSDIAAAARRAGLPVATVGRTAADVRRLQAAGIGMVCFNTSAMLAGAMLALKAELS